MVWEYGRRVCVGRWKVRESLLILLFLKPFLRADTALLVKREISHHP